MFINSLQRGGAETQFLRVARALQDAGHIVEIFVLLEDNDFAGRLDGLTVTLLAPRPGPGTVLGAIRALRRLRPDVVVNFLFQATIVGRVAAGAAGRRAVISSMRNERLETRARTLIYRGTGRLDRVTVTNSLRAADTLRASGTVRAAALEVIPNGVDLTMFDALSPTPLRETLGLDDDTFLYLGVGRLSAQKDWATLISAIARYDGPPAHWAIAGEGEDLEALTRQSERDGVSDRISFLGIRDDVPGLIAACDALVLSSVYEGLPNVVLEAMAVGRPVVATNVGGSPELVGPGRPDRRAA